MNPLRLGWVLLLLLSPGVFANTFGNTSAQEVADVVFRDIDLLPSRHSAIYIGQTNKSGNPTADAFFHNVIEMTGIVKSYLFFASKVEHIRVVNFGEFQRAHPKYYGAFRQDSSYGLETRKKILNTANALMRVDPPIEYVVEPWEATSKLLYVYFKLKGQETFDNYGSATTIEEKIGKIARMRSDAFVEFCYAAAGVPIAKDIAENPLDLTTGYGANALVLLAVNSQLFPDNQRDWMVASQVDSPRLVVTEDKTGTDLAGKWADTGVIDFKIDDQSSGPGFLSIHAAATGLVPGNVDIPTPIALLKDGRIETQNIFPSTTVVLSPAKGLVAGYYSAVAYDHAGNSSNLVNFTVPWYSLNRVDSASPLYAGFGGVSGMMPSTLDRAHTFTFSEPTAGVSSVSISGPQGNLVSWGFSPPVASTSAVLADLPVGEYQVKSWNAVGALTSTPFRIGEVSINISTPASAQSYVASDLAGTVTFYFSVGVAAESPDGLTRMELVSPAGRFLGTKPLDGTIVAEPVAVPEPGFWDLSGNWYGYKVGNYTARVVDAKGNIKDAEFELHVDRVLPSWGNVVGPQTGSYNYKTTVFDLMGGGRSFLPGAALANYQVEYSPEPAIAVRSNFGAAIERVGDAATCENISPQTIGTGQIYLNTWGKDDKSDLSRTLIESDAVSVESTYQEGLSCAVFGPGFLGCVRPLVHKAMLAPLQRYSELEVIFTVTGPNTFSAWVGTGNTVCGRYAVTAGPFWDMIVGGYALAQRPGTGPNVVAGEHIRVPLNSSGEVEFSNVVSSGNLAVSAIVSRPPAGYALVPQNTVTQITPDSALEFAGNIAIKFKYDPTGLSQGQIDNLKLAKVIDPATGKYEVLNASLDTVNKTISANITGFSKFMVLTPEYADPHMVQGGAINGFPELEFMAGAEVSVSQYDMSAAAGQTALANLKSANMLPVGNVYQVTSSSVVFEPSGAIKMRYSSVEALAKGISEDSLGIYGFSEAGDSYRLPYLTLDKDNKVLTARVPTSEYPLYAVLGSSVQVENIPPSVYPDGIPPETTLNFNGAAWPAEDGAFISSRTALGMAASDPQVPDVVTSGVSLTNYILNPDSATVEISTYTEALNLPEGVHPLLYLSVDNAGNYEFPKGTTVYVDATPPYTELVSSDTYEVDGKIYVSSESVLSLRADDPLANGVASGLFATLYFAGDVGETCPLLEQLVSDPPASLPTFTGEAGSCTNLLYSGPVRLSEGVRAVSSASFDKVANAGKIKNWMVYVDGTAPRVEIFAGATAIAVGDTAYITEGDSVTLKAVDLESNGVASGIGKIYRLIDVAPEECDSDSPSSACETAEYTAPFSLPVGTHTVYYSAVDNVGNRADVKSISVVVLEVPVEETGVFVPTGSIGVGRYAYTATLLGNGKVLVAGGQAGYPLNDVALADLYDPVSGTFSATGSMSEAREGHTATLLPNGKVLIVGGADADTYRASAELYDPATGIFSAAGSMSIGRYGHMATLLGNGKILIAGGRTTGNVEVASAELYDPATGVFSATGSMGVQRTAAGGLLLGNGKVLVMGGAIGGTFLRSAEIYDPATGTFSPTGSMIASRYWVKPVLLNNGKVLVTGGPVAGAELYDSASGTFSATGPMSTSRLNGTAVKLDSGNVLVAGGSNGSDLATAEIYNVGSGVFGPVPDMSTNRAGITGVKLADGRVLVASGYGGEYKRTAELFVPNGVVVAVPVVDNISPASGEAGAQLSITGSNFGEQVSGVSAVKIGGVSAAIVSWSDTAIEAVVPETLTPGTYGVTVERAEAGSTTVSNAVNFVVLSTVVSEASAEWHFDETSGDIAYDASGNGNNGTLYGPVWSSEGKVGGALDFNTGDYVRFPDSPSLNPIKAITVAAWIKYRSIDYYNSGLRIFAKGISHSFFVGGPNNHSSTLAVFMEGVNSSHVHSNTQLTPDEWYHVAYTYDGANVRFYLNGREDGVVAGSGDLTPYVGPAFSGTDPNAVPGYQSPLDGYIDELVVYDRALSADEIKARYEGVVVSSVTNTSADGLVAITTLGVDIAVSAISTETITSTMTVYTAMIDAGLEPVLGAFYEFEPSGVQFATPATLRFAFDPVGVDTTTLAIYYFDGVNWSSTSVLNQRVIFETATLAYLEGEITHTSIYALLRKKADLGPVVSVTVSPSTLNLDSNGGYITAELSFASGTGCFKPETVNISAVGDSALAAPIYAQKPGNGKKKGGYDVQCGTAAVKFDRDAVAAVLPANALVTLTVSGTLDGGSQFSAQDAIRTIRNFKAERSNKWHYSHACGAHIDGKAESLRDDQNLFMLKVERDLAWKETRKQRAAEEAGFKRRGAAFEFGPEGLRFEAPVTISLPYEAGEKVPERLAVAYWNDAKGVWEPLVSKLDKDGRFIKADVEHFSQYQIVELPVSLAASLSSPLPVADNDVAASQEVSQEFRLGQVYVYPDPAKGGKAPTFHVEVGLADTVRIRVFSVAGKQVHERTLTGSPQFAGGAYAYEYQWTGHIPSGVYYYTVEAERSGRKLRTKGKFAVVR